MCFLRFYKKPKWVMVKGDMLGTQEAEGSGDIEGEICSDHEVFWL